MAIGIGNLKVIMSNSRSRVIFILTLLTLLIASVIGISLFSHNGPAGKAKLDTAPRIQSVVGGFDKPVSPQYAHLLEEQNKSDVQKAIKTDGSAVPTIINAQPIGDATGITGAAANNACSCAPTSAPANLIQTGPAPVGIVCADGTVRNSKGQILGHTGIIAPGGLVYDKNGHVIGTVGPDGKVRDANGNVIGTLGADGTVRDANGNVIGTTATPASASGSMVGKPVYDKDGKLLGYVGADGKVRDASGKVIGTVGADGTVRDANGNVIGKAALGPKPGSLVYDKDGHVIGTVGADGKVRDANGNVVGTVGADGVVRDANGNVIGKANTASPGTAVYDSQGHYLGTVGPDGKVRDANGNVVGTVGPDGVVRDASGKAIGRTSYIAPGSAVYGPDGKLIGTVGPDGRLVPATIGPGAQGQGVPGVSGAAGGTPQEQALARQQQVLNRQNSQKLVAELQGAMSGQMSQLLASWKPPTQQVVSVPLTQADKAAQGLSAKDAAQSGSDAASASSFVKAGTIMFAVLDTAVNSDEPGPIMATITEGKLKGSRLIGTLNTFGGSGPTQGQKVMLSFTTMNMPGANASVPISTVAIDPGTARTALSSDTDNHYLLRYGTLFASSFLTGYAQAVSQSGSQTTYTINGIVHDIPALSAKQKLVVALGNTGAQYASVLGNIYNTPPTVKIYAGTGMGILFLSDMKAPPGITTDTQK